MQSGWITMVDYEKFKKGMEERYQESKKKAIEDLPANCAFLGIEYTKDMEKDCFAIEDAVKVMKECKNCKYDLMGSLSCEHAELVGLQPYTKRCEKFHKAWEIKEENEERRQCLIDSGIGKRFMGKRFENFNVTDQTEKAFNACVTFCDNYLAGKCEKGLKLFGNYGCGKTHLVSAIIHRLAESKKRTLFMVVPELLRTIRQGFNQDDDVSRKLVNKAETYPLLILDDLGAEKTSDWVREQLYIIINRRYENMLPTIVTTNCTTAELVERLGERTVSRLIEMTDAYKITADDYRLKKG
jgi:DNA replication protein DnaC